VRLDLGPVPARVVILNGLRGVGVHLYKV
jgi:hypothetical protein